PSSVSTSSLPPVTVIRHVTALEQSMDLNEFALPIGSALHVWPPSLERRNVSGPIAYAFFSSTKRSDVTRAPAGSAIGVHDTPASGVRYALLAPAPGLLTIAIPV